VCLGAHPADRQALVDEGADGPADRRGGGAALFLQPRDVQIEDVHVDRGMVCQIGVGRQCAGSDHPGDASQYRTLCLLDRQQPTNDGTRKRDRQGNRPTHDTAASSPTYFQ
jgi:hypothetical protein